MDHDNRYIADDRLAHIGSEATGGHERFSFPDADKFVHAVMFGMLTIGILADRQRQTGWKEIPVWMATLAVSVASGTGAGIEFLQEIMGLGRTFETADMIADAGGSMIAAQLFLMMQPRWTE